MPNFWPRESVIWFEGKRGSGCSFNTPCPCVKSFLPLSISCCIAPGEPYQDFQLLRTFQKAHKICHVKTKRIVLFASGSGTNVENIIRFFRKDARVTICCVLTNKRDAPVIDRCSQLDVSAFYFNRHAFHDPGALLKLLECLQPDLIVLAGFLWKIPDTMLRYFPDRILNIHPALLPKYGGKGMYGMKVHEAVKSNGETETGISIHYVNEQYDEGTIIEQVRIGVEPGDTAERIAEKVHSLEYEYFPKVIERVLFPGT